ncbi:MAG: hypothetical protein OEZ32_14015 [Nitrospinota bacterium]|nr:hypothetical protein [Nitrospinota bacterium]
MNFGAGLRQVFIDAPKLVQAYQMGSQMDEADAMRADIDSIVGDMTKMATFGQELEPLVDAYEKDVTPWQSRAGGEGVILQKNGEYGEKYSALYNKVFGGDDPPRNVKPPPSTFIDNPNEIPKMREYLDGLKNGMDSTAVRLLRRDPKALASYLMEREKAQQAAQARAALGGKVGDAVRSGDKAAIAQLGISSGDPSVMRAGDLLKEPQGQYGNAKEGVNPKTGKVEYFTINKSNGEKLFLGVEPPEDPKAAQQAAKEAKGDVRYAQDRLDDLKAERAKLIANKTVDGPEYQSALNNINREIAAAIEDMEKARDGVSGGDGGKTKKKVKRGDTHSKPASKYSNLW